jgi:hypothetical protein
MDINLALVSDYAIVDRFGKLSIMGIFEQLWIHRFPAVHPRVHLVLRLKGKRTEVGKHRVCIRFLNDTDEEIISGDGVFEFNEPPAGITEIEAGTVLVFDLPLAAPGPYRFHIAVDDEITTTVKLNVVQVPHPPPGVPYPPPDLNP